MDIFENDDNKSDNIYTIEQNDSISYTNTKGYYEFITKLMIAGSKARIMGDIPLWLEAIDTLFNATFPWWKNDDEVKKYQKDYDEVLKLIGIAEKSFNSNIKGGISTKIKQMLRSMNMTIMENTKHLMIRVEGSEVDNLDDWLAKDDD